MFFALSQSTGRQRCKLFYDDIGFLELSFFQKFALTSFLSSVRDNPYGIFGNQRMEMLDVAQTLRFHMPVVLFALANFRGLDSWDSKVLAPLVKDLMNYKVGESIQESSEGGLIDRLEKAAENVCGGVVSRVS